MEMFSNTRYDRLMTGLRRKSAVFIDEFDSSVFERKPDTDLEWLKYAKELIEAEIKITSE